MPPLLLKCNHKYVPNFICNYVFIIPVFIALFIEFVLLNVVISKLKTTTSSKKSFFIIISILQLLIKIYVSYLLQSHENESTKPEARSKQEVLVLLTILVCSFVSSYLLYQKEKLQLILVYFAYSLVLTMLLFSLLIYNKSLNPGVILIKKFERNLSTL